MFEILIAALIAIFFNAPTPAIAIQESPVGPSEVRPAHPSCAQDPQERDFVVAVITPSRPMTAEQVLTLMRQMGIRPATCAEMRSLAGYYPDSTQFPMLALDMTGEAAAFGQVDTTWVASLIANRPDGIITVSGRGTWQPGVSFLGVVVRRECPECERPRDIAASSYT